MAYQVDFDIIIVGAGPAGLSTALFLAQSAPKLAERTLILEREHHPRPKLCAGGVLPGAEAYLHRLGLDMSVLLSFPVQEICLQFQGSQYIIRHEPISFRVVRREQFDAWLADAARERGLELEEGVRVRGVRPSNGLVEIVTDRGDYRARAVVGADGAGSVVRKVIARQRLPQAARLLEGQRPASSQNGREGRALFDFSHIHHGLQGYVWDFPRPAVPCGHAMRTFGIYDSCVYPRAPRVSLKGTLGESLACQDDQLDKYRLEGHPFRRFHRRGPFSAPRLLLVGDAAGADPVAGEGISFALGYGEVAAGALQDAFAQGDFSFADYRQRVLRHRTGRYLSRRAVGARFLYGLRNRYLLRLLWPLIGWLAEQVMIDWG